MTTQISPLKQENVNKSATNLMQGLSLVGKTLISTFQWTSSFSRVQFEHLQKLKRQEKQLIKSDKKLTDKIKKGLSNFTLKTCRLCMEQQPNQNFILMCSCSHRFCYSCLNNYAICKIEDLERVSCPQPNCHSQMKLSSSVYKYLPEMVKLKYLQCKLKDKAQYNNLKNKCLRCLQFQHQGQCKVAYNVQNIEQAFNFRKCRKCVTEIKMTSGKRKVQCEKCKHTFCYVCGQDWKQKKNHKCKDKSKIKDFQKQINQKYSKNCCQCCHSDCCEGQNDCCRVICCCCDVQEFCKECCPDLSCSNCCNNCEECMGSCCYCNGCDMSVIMGNLVLFPIRIIISFIILAFYCLMSCVLIFFFLIWILGGIFTGITCFTCELIDRQQGFSKCLAYLFCPFIAVLGILKGLQELSRMFQSVFKDFVDIFSQVLCGMWINFSPKQCCGNDF